jgi:hypothetical protein
MIAQTYFTSINFGINKPMKTIVKMPDINQYDHIIYTTALEASKLAIPAIFLPRLNVQALSNLWIKMMLQITKKAGYQLKEQSIQEFILSLVQENSVCLIGGNKTETSLNEALNWLYTFRLGMFLVKQIEQDKFNINNLLKSTPTIKSMVFALPSLGDLRHAFSVLNLKN